MDTDDPAEQEASLMLTNTDGSGNNIEMYMPRIPSKDDSGVGLKDNETNLRRSQSLGNMIAKQPTNFYLDEDYLLGRRESSMATLKSRSRNHSHITITEVVPSTHAIVPVNSDHWKTPLNIFTDKKQGKKDKKLSKRLKSYYKEQDELIKCFEDIQLDNMDPDTQEQEDALLVKRAAQLAKLSFACNLMLLIAKSVAVGLSGSMSIISSLVDSIVDLLSGIIIWVTSRAIRKRNIYEYPGGRSRLEPTAIVILSVIMSLAAFQLIVESVQTIIGYVSREGKPPTVNLPVLLITAGTIVMKFVLFLLCYIFGRKSSSVRALYHDHRNDVFSNIVAILCGYLGSRGFIDEVGEYNVVFIDPIGAILISVYILVDWWRTGYGQIKLLTGHTADTNFLSKITWICLNHHKEIIYIDTVRAFHFGNNFLVEVDIVLPEEMSLKESHNIGETLQQKLEKFPLVERAFVHIDYEVEHNPLTEHKVI